MVCQECNGKGFITEADYNHDVVVRSPCMSCKHEELYLQGLETQVRMVFENVSRQKLIDVVATAIDSTDRLEDLIHTKNIPALLAYIG
jgi:hypothetical protein